LGHFFLVI